MIKKITLLAATTAICTVSAGTASAGAPKVPPSNVYAAAEINGNGASSIANVIVQELNCFGGPNNPLGLTTGTTAIPDYVYTPVKITTGNPVYDCSIKSVQDNINGHYVSTGSGGGKTSWSNLTAGGISSNPFGTWTRIQYAFSDSPISSGDITTYNTNAAPKAGAPIQIPMFVLPVAVAYSANYGKIMTASGVQPLTLQLKYPRADATGGLRLTRTSYCGIFNGTITNWNDPALQLDNGKQSLMDPKDNVSRWTTAGVPIKLVGRSENSGTTNIFSRHLGTVCGTSGNKFIAGGADQLPTAAKGTAVYNKTTGQLSSGTETTGVFGLADGSDGVAHAIDLAATNPTTLGEVTLNGRIGYLGADWVKPSTLSGTQLSSADLQSGLSTKKFAAPTAKNATLSFKGILPPQSDTKGKYNTTPVTGSMAGNRTNPLSWVFPASITYVDKNGTTVANPIAAPAAGYAIVGTTNMLLYTCYANADVRKAVQTFSLLHLGKVSTADDLTKVPAKLVSSPSNGADGLPLGINPHNGIAGLPAQFVTALTETFFTKVTTGNNPSSLNLYIQDKLQKKTTDVLTANSSCAALAGA